MSAEWPRQTVALDFPWTTCGTFQAQVVGWHAPADPRFMHDELFDIAVLRLTDEVSIEPARLALGEAGWETKWNNLNFSVAGFPPSKTDGDIARGQISGLLPGHRVQVFRMNDFMGKIQPGFSGAPAFADDGVVGMAFAADLDPKGVGYLVPSYRLEQAWLLARNPYKGLARFEPEDKDSFFGRTSEAEDLLRRVSGRIAIIVGPTGSGKSSLVFGGLRPKLSRQEWMVAHFRPRSSPLESLVEALTSLTGSPGDSDLIAKWLGSLQANPTNIFHIISGLRDNRRHKRLLLIADQMEEAFSLCKDYDDQRRPFFEVISSISNDRQSRACFLGTLRSEFLGRVLEDRTLATAIVDDEFFFLRPIASEQLRHIIAEPAARLGVALQDELIDKLVDQAKDERNLLTSLQFVLQRLWLHAEGGKHIGLDDYKAIGGSLREALTQYADARIDAMSQQDQEIARRLLCQLVNFGGETWSKRPRREGDLGDEGWAMATRLAGQPADRNETPLVVIRRDAVDVEFADLAHESLIGRWPKLGEWLEEARDLEVSLGHLREHMHAWQASKDGSLLLSGYDLARGRKLLEMEKVRAVPENVRQFIELSLSTKAEEDRQNALRERELALAKNQDITRASRQLLRVEEEAKELCNAVRSELGFDYVNVQLIDKGERTIGTVYGAGQQGNFFSIANHPLDNGDLDLLDIQAHIAAAPPKLEVIAGNDKRFDDFIFTIFGHEQHVRAFVPIIFGFRSSPTETLGWEWRDVHAMPNVDERGPGNRRLVCEAVVDQSTFDRDYDIIGTLEAGFGRPDADITVDMAQELVDIGHRFAGKLRQTTLQHVFETVVQAAHEVMKPTATHCGFAYNSRRARFGYEAWAGEVALFDKSCLPDQRCTEKITLLPNYSDLDAYKVACPAAYEAGLRAEARAAITVEDQRRHGILHLVFSEDKTAGRSEPIESVQAPPGVTCDAYDTRQFGFCDYDKIYLEALASRAEEAIQLATAVERQRMFARGLSNLHRIASALAEQPGAKEMLTKVAGYAMNMFAADLATVYEFDQTKNEFRPEAGLAGRFKDRSQASPACLDRGTAPFRLIGLGESQYDNQLYDPVESGPGGNPSFAVREEIKALAGIVLRTPAETFGALFLSYRTQRTFSQNERDLAEALASTAAIAIRNRRMLGQSG